MHEGYQGPRGAVPCKRGTESQGKPPCKRGTKVPEAQSPVRGVPMALRHRETPERGAPRASRVQEGPIHEGYQGPRATAPCKRDTEVPEAQSPVRGVPMALRLRETPERGAPRASRVQEGPMHEGYQGPRGAAPCKRDTEGLKAQHSARGLPKTSRHRRDPCKRDTEGLEGQEGPLQERH
ncbi:hypothetical protein NDU88_011370 [Pleurodeles waltl]|uniref:Uncharacterized protein n=1 Tax=Pleurodeles waltl TaxID=8319 RepID=A0AAV7PXK1_PLEWA|nr:hypothetical protein NDU88_011370 [Pleurodeles waltl]